jgi:alkanesulfonate monooxygenase SsuD/methylene tetrahydromethanopterin reductase-like flavin-dependent oxidoreductase (luciferase family)
METATLAGIAPGRVVLGLGTGVRRWIAEQMRIQAPRPLATLGECVDVIRRLWAGERVTHEGPGFALPDVALEYKPAQPELPIVPASGPRALALAGAVADGVVCSVMSSPAHVRRVRETIAPARRQSGRGPCPVLAYVPVAIGRDVAAARRSVRPLLARYLAHLHGQTILAEAGVSESQTLAIRAASAGRREPPSSGGSDQRLRAPGSPDHARRRLEAWLETGLDTPSLALARIRGRCSG